MEPPLCPAHAAKIDDINASIARDVNLFTALSSPQCGVYQRYAVFARFSMGRNIQRYICGKYERGCSLFKGRNS
jgi:hypothetical protein